MAKLSTIVAGDRNFTDYAFVEECLLEIQSEDWEFSEIVSGGARGVDFLGEQFAREHGIEVRVFEAQWERYGRGAGPIRNDEMAQHAQALVAFPSPGSKGTKSMIAIAKGKGLLVKVIHLPNFVARAPGKVYVF